MTPEQLDQLLAALPPLQNPPEVPPERPQRAASALSACGAAVLELMSGQPLHAPAIATGPTEAQKAEHRASHRAWVVQQREQLWPRIRDAKLATRIRSVDSPCGLLIGPTGIGKTSAARWIGVRYPGFWASAHELGAAERHHELGGGWAPLIRSAVDARHLYLDDLGTEESRDLSSLQYVIDQRYAAGRATFATTGLTRDDLATHLGAAYVRRLVEQHVKRRDGTEHAVLFVDCHGVKL
jgi:hypothetical protein